MLPKANLTRYGGGEAFKVAGRTADFNVLEFWRWAMSDLVSNAPRGILAEFIVARAIGVPTTGIRDPWAPQDLISCSGIRIEVKSAAFLQAWAQKKLSSIRFDISATRDWNSETSEFAKAATRSSDVFVFALLSHQDKSTLDPLELDQWQFYVLSTDRVNEMCPTGSSISLAALRGSKAGPVPFSELRSWIDRAHEPEA